MLKNYVRFYSCITAGPSTTLMLNASVEGSAGQPIAGQTYALMCAFSGHGNTVPCIQWLRNGTRLKGETSNDLNFRPLIVTDSGLYSCEVTAESITVTSSNKTLTVESKTCFLATFTLTGDFFIV